MNTCVGFVGLLVLEDFRETERVPCCVPCWHDAVHSACTPRGGTRTTLTERHDLRMIVGYAWCALTLFTRVNIVKVGGLQRGPHNVYFEVDNKTTLAVSAAVFFSCRPHLHDYTFASALLHLFLHFRSSHCESMSELVVVAREVRPLQTFRA